jgi:hypothetical protein
MKFRLTMLSALVAVGIAFPTVTAQAAIVVGLNQISYSDREQLATYNDATHTYTAAAPGTIAVGDHLYGVLASTVESPNAGPPNATSVFDIVIAKIINPATGAAIGAGYTGTAEILYTTDSSTTGGVTGGFLTGGTGTTYTLADGSTVNGLGEAANSLLAAYQGSTLTTANPPGANLDTLANEAASVKAATSGTFFGSFGLGSALTDASSNSSWGAAGTGYWAADVRFVGGNLSSGTVPFVFGLVPTSQPAINFVGLYNELVPLQTGGEPTGTDGTNIYQNTGITPLVPDTAGPPLFGPVTSPTSFQLVGGGHAFANTTPGTAGWPTGSADPVWVDPKVPEPGTMLIMGMGLAFGLPYLRRRQKAVA